MTELADTEFDPAVVEALGQSIRDGSLELFIADLALPAVPEVVADPVPVPALL